MSSFSRVSILVLAALAAACSSSSSGGSGGGGAGTGGGPVSGPADAHCGSTVQPTTEAACFGGGSGGSMGMGGMMGTGGMMMSEYGDTLYGSSGDDDDCKYHVAWTSTPIAEGSDVTFTVVATKKADGKPLTGAETLAEVFLNDTHPGPNTDQKVTESKPGTYEVGPVRFDAAGKWTVRFHFYAQCGDESPESPHGHAAFYVAVP